MHPEDRELLGKVRVASPCHASWAGMSGDERVRFCQLCQRNVYNLSEMTAQEAATLVREAEGRLCVRYYQRADGTMLTRDCPVGLAAARQKVYVAACSAWVMLCSLFLQSRRPEPVAELTAAPAVVVSPPPPITASPPPTAEFAVLKQREVQGRIAVHATMGVVPPILARYGSGHGGDGRANPRR